MNGMGDGWTEGRGEWEERRNGERENSDREGEMETKAMRRAEEINMSEVENNSGREKRSESH